MKSVILEGQYIDISIQYFRTRSGFSLLKHTLLKLSLDNWVNVLYQIILGDIHINEITCQKTYFSNLFI